MMALSSEATGSMWAVLRLMIQGFDSWTGKADNRGANIILNQVQIN